ncbi:hypothetical protein IMG5_196310 [Ichthyophthirius multifiliis]|uniref:Transmembrane protein n=1 Tax=Ichthyophthirius multifiliis TaxID=5932 RepID=G0R546_ICHMU|nr:hypothetical protein IMG5_196310 [Ichthyophthirius multifiliis]EGR27448.1 hypothetical protein IMG5_196310 [Ichthyophthirius multifiliis]|eukprot:XP_004024358.1 hypothetical protein IMG5_196310 [Ichthyophthirius multifiliis]
MFLIYNLRIFLASIFNIRLIGFCSIYFRIIQLSIYNKKRNYQKMKTICKIFPVLLRNANIQKNREFLKSKILKLSFRQENKVFMLQIKSISGLIRLILILKRLMKNFIRINMRFLKIPLRI